MSARAFLLGMIVALAAPGCGGAGSVAIMPQGRWASMNDGPVTARIDALVLWTEAAMFVWGGTGPCASSVTCGDGGLYAPLDDHWEAIGGDATMAARTGHRGVWTGDAAIVWGGACGDKGTTPCDDGGIFTPADKRWRAMGAAGSPPARARHTAVWTGSEMIVWGGQAVGTIAALGDGGRYSVASSTSNATWRAVAAAGAPSPRRHHTAVWTGTEMIVWGGDDMPSRYHQLGDGARYDPVADTWRPIAADGAPAARYLHGAVWTGKEMIVWGGLGCGATADGDPVPCSDGARYDPRTDRWTPMSTEGAPKPRAGNTVVWTGAELIVWGGVGAGVGADGAAYDPANDRWVPMTATDTPAGRESHAAVWAGDRMLIWGGVGLDGSELPLGSGAQFFLEP